MRLKKAWLFTRGKTTEIINAIHCNSYRGFALEKVEGGYKIQHLKTGHTWGYKKGSLMDMKLYIDSLYLLPVDFNNDSTDYYRKFFRRSSSKGFNLIRLHHKANHVCTSEFHYKKYVENGYYYPWI